MLYSGKITALGYRTVVHSVKLLLDISATTVEATSSVEVFCYPLMIVVSTRNIYLIDNSSVSWGYNVIMFLLTSKRVSRKINYKKARTIVSGKQNTSSEDSLHSCGRTCRRSDHGCNNKFTKWQIVFVVVQRRCLLYLNEIFYIWL